MLPLEFRPFWRFASAILLVTVLAATMMPAVWLWPDKGKMLAWFVHVDKWAHAITFLVLAVWFGGLYRRDRYWHLACALVAFGVLIEGCQRLVTYRSAEWYDIVADAAGILVGLGIALAGASGWTQYVENWYLRRRANARID